MKQLLLILSFIAMAFLAACSEGKLNTPTKKGKGFEKTIEQLDTASSDISLETMKAQLEVNANVSVPDITSLVRGKFASVKPVPAKAKELDKKNETPDMLQKLRREQDEQTEKLNLQESELLANVKMSDAACDPTKIEKSKDGNIETRIVYIKNCDTQIIINRELGKDGKLAALNAFVAVKVKKENLEHLDSVEGNKTVDSISGVFSASTGSMVLKINLKLKSNAGEKDLIINTAAFAYGNGQNLTGSFDDKNGMYKGTFESRVIDNNNALILEFVRNNDIVSTKMIDDMGLFGKITASKETAKSDAVPKEGESEEDVSGKAVEKETITPVTQSLSPKSGVVSPTNPKGKVRMVPNPNSRY